VIWQPVHFLPFQASRKLLNRATKATSPSVVVYLRIHPQLLLLFYVSAAAAAAAAAALVSVVVISSLPPLMIDLPY
jgi:hypothetical protein